MPPCPWISRRANGRYSPSSVIGGKYAQFIERYGVESDDAFRTLPVERDLRYGPALRARLDYFPAPASASRPGLLVYIHGGYWQELSKDQSAFLAPAWHTAGFAHAVVGYTLAPEARLPDIVAECRSALLWLRERAATLGFDAGNVVVAGSSAGGYLAAACADGPMPLRGIVPVSGIFDVAPLLGTSINDALGLDASTAAAARSVERRTPLLPRPSSRGGRLRRRSSSARAAPSRRGWRRTPRPARASRFQAATISTWCSSSAIRRHRSSTRRAPFSTPETRGSSRRPPRLAREGRR